VFRHALVRCLCNACAAAPAEARGSCGARAALPPCVGLLVVSIAAKHSTKKKPGEHRACVWLCCLLLHAVEE
jgi:hypothetical protein